MTSPRCVVSDFMISRDQRKITSWKNYVKNKWENFPELKDTTLWS